MKDLGLSLLRRGFLSPHSTLVLVTPALAAIAHTERLD